MDEPQTDPEQEVVLSTFWERAQQAQAQGKDQEARAWLEGIVDIDQANVDAWLALAHLVPDARERMDCYSRVLQLSPGNDKAKAGLRRTRRQL